MPFSHPCYRLAMIVSAAMWPLGWTSPVLANTAADDDGHAITVYGSPDGYDTDQTPTATRTQTPLIDVPQSVTVISREQLDDQGFSTLNDALRYVPGVTLGQGEGHRDQITLRGQSSTADFFSDGIRDDAQYYRPLYNVERIEVLKGANALIFGRGGGGGVVNRVSKDPVYDRSQGSVSGGIDTLGAWLVAADLGAPLSESVALRLNATYENLGNHRQLYGGHFVGVSPTLGAKWGADSSVTLSYEYVEDRRLIDRGLPSRGGVPLTGYDNTLFGSPETNRSEVTAHLVHGQVDHEFTDTLSGNLSLRYANFDKFYSNVYPNAPVSLTGIVVLAGYHNAVARTNLIGQGNLIWKGRSHTLLLGFEAGDQGTYNTRNNAVFASGSTATLAKAITLPPVTFPAVTGASQSDSSFWSVYAQDQLNLGEQVKIVAGLRYDRFRISSVNLVSGFAGRRSDGKWSTRFGLILKPLEIISIYASYAQSFLPQSGDQFTVLDATTQALAPEQFQNLEVGVKWDITPALAFTAAVFRLDRSNTRATDPVSGNAVLTGKNRAEGIEFALVGRVADGLDLALGYALQNGEIRATTTAAPAGRKLAQLPRHQFAGWARYNFTPRFGLGLGVVHQSGTWATISNTVRLPAFTRIDAAAFYKVSDSLTVQLNVENLTDTNYFPSAHTDNNITTGKPLNVKFTLRLGL